MSAVVELDTVSRTFPGSPPVEAVREASLDVAENDYVAIFGPSGSGKTTLLRCMAGLEKAPEGRMTLNGRLAVGAYGVLVFLTQRLLWPLTGLAETVDLYERAMASSRRVLGLIEAPVGIRDAADAVDVGSVEGGIGFRQVSFAYGSGADVLSDLDFEIAPTETVAFVGPTGAGKSSLVKLILRFYEPRQGQILLDGHPLASIRLDSLRRQIGLVSQDVFLFDGTIRDNIAYGAPDADEAAIVEAARAAEAMEFVERLPQGLDSVVGERGQKLSGGQRQRLSLARALLKDPPILILDEATSALDSEVEAECSRLLELLG